MPSIILPSRWKQQPNYPVQLRAEGLGVGVHAAVLPIGGALVDLARRRVISTTHNSPDIIQASGGRQARIDNANEAWESPFTTTPGEMSLGWFGDFLGASTDVGGVFGVTHSSDSGALPYVANTLKRMSSGDMYYQFNNAGSYNAILQSSVGTTGRKSLVGTCTSGAQQVYVNGVAGASASYSGAIQFGSGSRLFVGEDYRLSTRNGNVGMYLGVVWGRALSKQEALAFYRAPYGELFVPRRRVLYFETAGGAVTINATPGDATAAGVSAQVLVGTLIQATPGNATADGAAAQVLVGVLIQATPADVTADGVTATVQVGSHTIIAASPALGEALGVTAQILVGTLVNAVPADAVAAGVAAQVLAAVLVQATPGEATAEGVDALVSIPGETTLTAADLDAIFSYEIEPGVTLLSALRIMFAPFAGKREGLGTATERYMAQDGTKPRITFSPTDAAGNGTPVVDGS